ncbi:hypothetical protein Tco_1051850, partial [Tanacetum coccineum]
SGKDLKLVSAIKIRKYLEKDCVTYLAHIVDKGTNVKSIQNIPIRRNHIEVFPKDLSGLSSTRIVEFWIDLVPGAAPVTKAPCRLALSEMQELSRELQELLSKRLIKTEFVTLGCTSFSRMRNGMLNFPSVSFSFEKYNLSVTWSMQRASMSTLRRLKLLKIWEMITIDLKEGKLNPRYTGPLKVLSKVSPVTYQLELPQKLHGIHDVFHVSNLKKCLTDQSIVEFISLKFDGIHKEV